MNRAIDKYTSEGTMLKYTHPTGRSVSSGWRHIDEVVKFGRIFDENDEDGLMIVVQKETGLNIVVEARCFDIISKPTKPSKNLKLRG